MIIDEDVYLQHSGIKGMKWGVRRAQKKAKRLEINRKKQEAFKNAYDQVIKEMQKRPMTRDEANNLLRKLIKEQGFVAISIH